MNLIFEDEDEYSEGLDVFEKHMKVIGPKPTTTGTDSELSTSRVTVSERTRTFTIQRATTSNRSPSPMDIDSPSTEEMRVDERISSGAATTATKLPSTSASRPASGTAVPAKRPTDMHDFPNPSSPPPSPGILPQPAKRLHASTGAPRKPPQSSASDFGSELDPFIIANDVTTQRLFDEYDIAWGTMYEIARGITKGRWMWSEVTREKVGELRGDNASAAQRVVAVMQGREVPRATAAEVWVEYDREQGAILENKGRGLGGMGEYKGKDDWYGGRIQQVSRLLRANGRFSIQLEKPEIRRSHRFARYLGSRRILQVKVPEDLLYKHGEDVRLLLNSSKFVLCGRIFLPFHAKEGSVYLVEINQDYQRTPTNQQGDYHRISLNNFINWHNPLHLNSQQPISKWSTRWALGLSTSVPTIVIDHQNIFEMEDTVVTPKDWEGKTPAEKILTDGCGWINGAALTQIMRVMKYGSRPTAVQGRIGGAKGMWVLHPDPLEQVSDGPAKIWIRSSQSKIKLEATSKLGKDQRIFDLLAPSRVTSPSRLSSQTLINLSHNGISHQILIDLMTLGLREEIQPFIDWNQPQSMLLVWKAVERAGNVVATRLRRLLAGQARALGLGQLHPLDNQSQENEKGDELDDLQSLADLWHKKSSGQPLTLHETVLELLQSGFSPLKLDVLFQKLEHVITLVLDDYVQKFHIPVKDSCEAYIVPDPFGVLEEGQVHFRSSEPIIDSLTGEQTDIILGDVLVSRNPTRLPSDVQKVRAVAHPRLSNYTNVIIFPIKGKQSLASFLGGGDYDGDTVMLNWCKPLVEQFIGFPLCGAPANISSFFESEVECVTNFDQRVSKLKPKEAQQQFQKILLLGLAETRVGLYSKFHDAAVYEHGYADQRAIHLAYMFTTCLDASKTGLRVKPSVFTQDKQTWGTKKPWYEWKLSNLKDDGHINPSQSILQHQHPSFILDLLVEEGIRLKDETLENYRKLKAQFGEEDRDLSNPWSAAKGKAATAKSHGILGFTENLEDIQAHVKEAWTEYQRARPIGSDAYDKVACSFAKLPPFRGFIFFSDEEIYILKASYASTISLTFAVSVAFRDLCAIKARAQGSIAFSHQFAHLVTIPSVVTHTLSRV